MVQPKNGFIATDVLVDFGMRGDSTAFATDSGDGDWYFDAKPCLSPPACWESVASLSFSIETASCVDVFDRTALVCFLGQECHVYELCVLPPCEASSSPC